MKELGLYIHIPFCKRKCYYCDFCSYSDKIKEQDRYVDSVIKEIRNIKCKNNYVVKTIYIGGGTPSIIDCKNIERIVNEIKLNFALKKEIEITIEVNPGTIIEENLIKYKALGINRISIGLQTANDELLKTIGRIHNYKDFEKTYDLVRKSGFNNVNVDLMIGLPNQKIEDVQDSLKKIIEKNPEHISVYSLIIEEGTQLEKMIKENIYTLPNEDTERKMYWNVKEILEKNGYNHYEISNFSKQSYQSKHNTDCWNQKEYIGLGVAAHSYLNKTRYSNTCNIEEYIKNIENNEFDKNITIHEHQNKTTMMNEYIILGLRMLKGISIKSFEEKFLEDPMLVYKKQIEKLLKKELIEVDEKNIKLSKKGIDFANIVWEEFI